MRKLINIIIIIFFVLQLSGGVVCANVPYLNYRDIFYKKDISKLQSVLKRCSGKKFDVLRIGSGYIKLRANTQKIVRGKPLRWANYTLEISLIANKNEAMFPIIKIRSRPKSKIDKFFNEIYRISNDIKVYKRIQIACLDSEKDRNSPTRHDEYLTIIKIDNIYLEFYLKTSVWYRKSFPPEMNITYPVIMGFLSRKDYKKFLDYYNNTPKRKNKRLISFSFKNDKFIEKDDGYKMGWEDNLVTLGLPHISGEVNIGNFNLKILKKDEDIFQKKIREFLINRKCKIIEKEFVNIFNSKETVWFFKIKDRLGFVIAIKRKKKYPFLIEAVFKVKKISKIREIMKDIVKSIKLK